MRGITRDELVPYLVEVADLDDVLANREEIWFDCISRRSEAQYADVMHQIEAPLKHVLFRRKVEYLVGLRL